MRYRWGGSDFVARLTAGAMASRIYRREGMREACFRGLLFRRVIRALWHHHDRHLASQALRVFRRNFDLRMRVVLAAVSRESGIVRSPYRSQRLGRSI